MKIKIGFPYHRSVRNTQAYTWDNPCLVRYLVNDKGADLQFHNCRQRPRGSVFCYQRRTLEHGEIVRLTDEVRPLHLASLGGHFDIVQYHVEDNTTLM